MTTTNVPLDFEASMFASFLHIHANDQQMAMERYIAAVNTLGSKLSAQDARVMKVCKKFPVLLPLADAGLAFLNPLSALRRRLLVMAAIKETIPSHYNDYILEETVSGVWKKIIFRCISGACRTACGIVLVLFLS